MTDIKNPITSEKIVNDLGWKHQSTASDGGTKMFANYVKGQHAWISLRWRGDNFAVKGKEQQYEVIIEKTICYPEKGTRDPNWHKNKELFRGFVKEMNDLKSIVKSILKKHQSSLNRHNNKARGYVLANQLGVHNTK